MVYIIFFLSCKMDWRSTQFVYLAILALAMVRFSNGSTCTYAITCYRDVSYSCGFWDWQTCHRTEGYTCYEQRCCSGWTGGSCSTPICSPGCENGGTCVQPDTCRCTIYYSGSRCQTRKSCLNKQIEIFLILDSSGSIGQHNFNLQKRFAQSFVENLDVGENKIRIGLMTYSRYPYIRFRLYEYTNQSSLQQAIGEIPYLPGITETHTALKMLQEEAYEGSRTNVTHAAVLITEGKSQHPEETKTIAASLHSQGIYMFVVGVGPDILRTELEYIATNHDDKHLFTAANYSSLQSILPPLVALVCDEPVTISHARRNPIDECREKVADVVFLLDTSSSIGSEHFKDIELFVVDIVNDFEIAPNATRVGVITYSTYPVPRISLGETVDKLQLLNKINQIRYLPGTRETDRAFEMLRLEGMEGNRPEAPNIAIIVTDGPSTNSFLTRRAADALKQTGVEIFVVGIGDKVDMTELEYFTNNAKNHVFNISNFVELRLSYFENDVAEIVCAAIPKITSTSTTTTTSPTTATTTQTIITTESFDNQNGSADCLPDVADVMFLVDSSGSIGDENFEKVKMFVKQTIETLDIGRNHTRVGLILFSSFAKIVITLDQFNNSKDLIEAVDKLRYTPGGTNTGAALELLRTQALLNDRPHAPNIAFLITDGYSTDKIATRQQARLVKETNQTVIVATGIGNFLDFNELADIASSNYYTNASLIYHVDDFDELKVQTLQNILANVICGVELANLTFATHSTTMSTTVAVATNLSHCHDTVENCAAFGRDSCADYRPWAMSHCPRFCGFCEGPSTTPKPCIDRIGNCREYGHYICTTTAFSLWAQQNCARFCEFCGAPITSSTVITTPAAPTTTPLACRNTVSNCNEYGGDDMCSNPMYAAWAKNHCKEYCGFCSNFVDINGQTLNSNVICPDWHLPKVCKLEMTDGSCCPLPQCPPGYIFTAE